MFLLVDHAANDVPDMACDDYDYDANDDLGDAAALEALDAIEDCKPQIIKQEKVINLPLLRDYILSFFSLILFLKFSSGYTFFYPV
jgi:hypothetical protein